MKRCRYCAEEIQDAAVLCRFCGRSQAPDAGPGGDNPWVQFLSILLVLLGVGAVAYALIDSDKARTALSSMFPGTSDTAALESTAPVPPPAPPPPPPPFIVSMQDEVLFVEAGHYSYYTFELTDPRPCMLRGHIEGIEGGSHDFDVLVLDQDGFINWKNGHSTNTWFQERRRAAATLNVPLPSPGSYRLVISNAFSILTDKRVSVENLRAVCE